MLLTAFRLSLSPRTTLRSTAALVLLAFTGLLTACGGGGGGGGGSSPPPAVTLKSIAVTAANASPPAGTSTQLTATGTYSDNTTKDLTSTSTWAVSSGGSSAMVNTTTGLLTTAAAGAVVITATSAGVSSSPFTLNVAAALVKSLAVSPANPVIFVGGTQRFKATGTYTDGSTKDVTGNVTWAAANADATTTSGSTSGGIATGVTATAPNSVAITASIQGYTSTGAGTVTNTIPAALTITGAPTAISISTAAATSIALGTTEQLRVIGTFGSSTTPYDITSYVTWGSSGPAISVGTTTGLVTAVAITNTPVTITATFGPNPTLTSTLGISVTAASLQTLVISPASTTISLNGTQPFTATGKFSDGTTQDLTTTVQWVSATPSIASISSTGVAQAGTTLGKTSITASLNSVSAAAVPLTVTTTLYLYVSNFGDNTVSQYTIGTGGVLTPLTGTATSLNPIAAGNEPFSVALEPTGQFVYVANFSPSLPGSVSQYTLGATGLLSPVVPSATVPTGNRPNNITLDHNNPSKFAYVANYGDSTLSQYSISLSTGALTPLGAPVPNGAGTFPSAITVHPNPNLPYAYVTDWHIDSPTPPTSNSTVTQYVVNANGTLTPNPTAATVACGGGPNAIVIDPSGQFAYVVNAGTNDVSQYSVQASNGALIPITSSNPTSTGPNAVKAGMKPFGLAIDPTSQYLYVANANDGTISQYTIGAGGALTPMSTPSIPSVQGSTTSGVSFVSIDPTGSYLYAANRGAVPGSISQFSIGPGGALVALTPATVPTGQNPTSIAIGY